MYSICIYCSSGAVVAHGGTPGFRAATYLCSPVATTSLPMPAVASIGSQIHIQNIHLPSKLTTARIIQDNLLVAPSANINILNLPGQSYFLSVQSCLTLFS